MLFSPWILIPNAVKWRTPWSLWTRQSAVDLAVDFQLRCHPPPNQQEQSFSELHTPTSVTGYHQEGCLSVTFTGRLKCHPHSQASSIRSVAKILQIHTHSSYFHPYFSRKCFTVLSPQKWVMSNHFIHPFISLWMMEIENDCIQRHSIKGTWHHIFDLLHNFLISCYPHSAARKGAWVTHLPKYFLRSIRTSKYAKGTEVNMCQRWKVQFLPSFFQNTIKCYFCSYAAFALYCATGPSRLLRGVFLRGMAGRRDPPTKPFDHLAPALGCCVFSTKKQLIWYLKVKCLRKCKVFLFSDIWSWIFLSGKDVIVIFSFMAKTTILFNSLSSVLEKETQASSHTWEDTEFHMGNSSLSSLIWFKV